MRDVYACWWWLTAWAVLLNPVHLSAASDPQDLVLRLHFAGAQTMMAGTNSLRLQGIAILPESKALYQRITEKIALHAPELLSLKLQAGQNGSANQLQPVVNDLWDNEAWVEVWGQGLNRQCIVAAAVSTARQSAWEAALKTLPLADHSQVRCGIEGKWVFIASGSDAAKTAESFATRLKTSGLPDLVSNRWMEVELKGATFAELLPLPFTEKLEAIHLAMSFHKGDMLANASLRYAGKLTMRLDPWRIPTNFIRDPVTSFAALNGVEPWLAKNPIANRLKLDALPNQVYGWSMAGLPFITYAAAPLPNPTNLIGHLAKALPLVLLPDGGKTQLGSFLWASNRAQIVWQGLPFLSPTVQCRNEDGQDYLVTGLIGLPMASKRRPGAPELFQQVKGRTNLVYYHWELTGERARCWNEFMQNAPLFTDLLSVPTTEVGHKWVMTVPAVLGETVTQVIKTSDNELTLSRRGPLCCTGFELNLLTRWLDILDAPPGKFKLVRPNAMRFKGTNPPPFRPKMPPLPPTP
ncbi:MAG: hypothetical protein WCO56_19465 [Verrucomicrobiota bacterium]